MKSCVLAIALLAVAGPVLAAEPAPDPQPKPCPAAAPELTANTGRAGPRRLGDLPPASHVLTVLKSVGGCPVAVTKVGNRTVEVPLPGQRQVRREDATPRRR